MFDRLLRTRWWNVWVGLAGVFAMMGVVSMVNPLGWLPAWALFPAAFILSLPSIAMINVLGEHQTALREHIDAYSDELCPACAQPLELTTMRDDEGQCPACRNIYLRHETRDFARRALSRNTLSLRRPKPLPKAQELVG
ncbi:MAG: hypothetical protein AAGD00_00115 [Planctomycetota bacterium]